MKLRYLHVEGYKNLRCCEIDFTQSPLINAVIGSNGSGKSNMIEAMLHILLGCYFGKAPQFTFTLEFVAHDRTIVLQRKAGRPSVMVDGENVPFDLFTKLLRAGPAQDLYPALTLTYYSGECRRLQRLIARYRKHFQQLTQHPATDRFRPLFVQSSNEQSQVILLSLFAHGRQRLLNHLKLNEISDVCVELRSPDGYDPSLHEPKLWNTTGAIRRIVAALDDTASSQGGGTAVEDAYQLPNLDARRKIPIHLRRRYYFADGGGSLTALARRLEKDGDNLYLALESLRARGIFRSVSFLLRGAGSSDRFDFDHLSEGEKQLLAVVGAVTLASLEDNLILLDEPDTHLNPHWSWEYPSMLTEALRPEQQLRSTVLMATHDPVMISGMVSNQVLLAHGVADGQRAFSRPVRNPRGQGIANILCSSEFFGLPSSLDKETQKLLDERLRISIKTQLTAKDRSRLRVLNEQLEILPGVSERDPDYVAFLRQRNAGTEAEA